MARRKVGNPLALAVLALLAERPRHPYNMARRMRERHHEESIKLNYGSLYMVVEQLTRAGFVAAAETVRDAARPERTVYAITEAGRAELDDWMRELSACRTRSTATSRPARADGHPAAGRRGRLLWQRRDRLAKQGRRQRQQIDDAVAGGLHPVFLVEDDYRQVLLDAELGFVDRLIGRIDGEYARD